LFAVLLGNEFDINVGLKKRRKRDTGSDPDPETFLRKLAEIVASVDISADEIRITKSGPAPEAGVEKTGKGNSPKFSFDSGSNWLQEEPWRQDIRNSRS
jgi:hypothetical protein